MSVESDPSVTETTPDRPSLTRRERYRRSVASETFLMQIGAARGCLDYSTNVNPCHDIPVVTETDTPEPSEPLQDGYVVEVDMEHGGYEVFQVKDGEVLRNKSVGTD